MMDASHNSIISKFNEFLALRITIFVGTIWAFYAVVIFGLTPLFFPSYEEQILYWSNFLQLAFLPVITVGTAILSRDSEYRAAEDHATIQQEFVILKEHNVLLHKSLDEIRAGMKDLLARSDQNRSSS